MPGEHIDKLVQGYTDRLLYDGPDQDKKSNKVGTDIFNEIESSTLTAQEKQEVYQKLVKAGVQDELKKATADPTTMMRTDSITTRFMTDYMNVYAKDYIDAVRQDTLTATVQAKSQLPSSLNGKMNPFGNYDGVSEQDKAQILKVTGEISTESIRSGERNLTKLSPEAREFMKAALEPLGENQGAKNTVVSNTLLLRGALAQVNKDAVDLRLKPETRDVGELMFGANKATLTFGNTINRPLDNPLGTDKEQNQVVNQMRTKENMGRTLDAFKAVSQGSDSINNFVSEIPLRGFNDRLKELNDKKTQLEQNPTFGDKFKAFFQHGLKGVKGEIEKIEGKIEVTELAKQSVKDGTSMEDLQKKLDGMKVDRAEYLLAMKTAKDVVTLNNAAKSVNMESSFSKEQVDKAILMHETVKPEAEKVQAKIDQQEKVMSVREKLGPKAPQTGQGQSQGKGVSV
ncbi:hypothetical protein DES53_104249 [Roseimicrobium gellanilyticum]|uniref:Ras-GAP domain-containing protein n=1 Tax=Roseimicrobium gellanilyticum TaxID=748857 RepID=A0A366HMQ2_9BACT|nr:hypothetical protein [Roseimicrobium gellanilyticum]RBP44429.1 hypothetical protein DES53_104249 [Roseimicrobium gellanilyticum]